MSPLPRNKNHALKRIMQRNNERRRRAFIRDLQTMAVISAGACIVAATVIVVLCIALGIPL